MDGLEDKLQQILNDPDSMAQILSLAQSFGGQSSNPKETFSAPTPPSCAGEGMPDLAFVQGIMELMQQAQRSDEKQEALLCALKPFLRPERRAGIDRALALARISHLAGYALKNYGGLLGKKEG